jgi:hypothetical protein
MCLFRNTAVQVLVFGGLRHCISDVGTELYKFNFMKYHELLMITLHFRQESCARLFL